MSVSFDFTDRVVLITGACGSLGSSVVEAFHDKGATVCAVDVIDIEDDDSLLDPGEDIHFYRMDATDESAVEAGIEGIIDDHDRLHHVCNVAGTWRGGQPIEDTPVSEVESLFRINYLTAFLVSKHAIPYLVNTNGTIVNVSARSGLSGGSGDGPYRSSKAAVKILTETIAEEHLGTVRANAILPSVIDTPMNREMMEPSDDWVDPRDIATVMLWLSSDGSGVTSGAAIPVYGEA